MLKSQYFDWLFSLTGMSADFTLLLKKLYLTEFYWSIPFDANRADDGIQLRYRFGRENGVPDAAICAELDDRPCSILEMIAALALRCEENIMSDVSLGDRVPLWVRQMLNSLGLTRYDDAHYDEREVDRAIYIFLERRYSRTGEGGLFTVPDLDRSRDMRTAEIWWQMNWYMNEH